MRTVQDRSAEGTTRFGSERESYNGREGGKNFMWYSRPVFNKYLAQLRTSEVDCSERDCMEALRLTSEEIAKYPMTQQYMVKFAGPQCYPHIDPRSKENRLHANENVGHVPGEEEQGGDGGGAGPGACAGADDGATHLFCMRNWAQCDRCHCWRLLLPACAARARGDEYYRVRDTDLDWEEWLRGAADRCAGAATASRDQDAALGGEGGDVMEGAMQQGGGADEGGAAGGVRGGARKRRLGRKTSEAEAAEAASGRGGARKRRLGCKTSEAEAAGGDAGREAAEDGGVGEGAAEVAAARKRRLGRKTSEAEAAGGGEGSRAAEEGRANWWRHARPGPWTRWDKHLVRILGDRW